MKIIYLILIFSYLTFGTFFQLATAQTWESVGNGLDGEVRAFTEYKGNLYVAGGFYEAGLVPKGSRGIRTYNIAKWNGAKWDSVGHGLHSGRIFSLAVYRGNLYAGGDFKMEMENIRGIAKWNDTIWKNPGWDINGINYVSVYSMAVYNDCLYIGGDFYFKNEGSTHLMKWDGTKWDTTGLKVSGRVNSLVVYNNELYVGGEFTKTGIIKANRIAKWNGIRWDSIDTRTNKNLRTIFSMVVYKKNLYAAGEIFIEDKKVLSSVIGKWNDTTWTNLNEGVKGGVFLPTVFSLTVHNDNLYVAGSFETIENITVNNIASWNGTAWSSTKSSLRKGELIFSSIEYRGELYIGGKFEIRANETPVSYGIAKWSSSKTK
jgi:hypothetical protein